MNASPMHRTRKLLGALCVLLALGPFAAHAEMEQRVSFTFENDFFAGFDRHYTNGMQLAFLTEVAAAPDAMRAFSPLRFSADPQAVLAVGQRIYTPASTDLDPPAANDRPYAGWLYLMSDVRTVATPTVQDHLTVTAGVVGPGSGARQTQSGIHHLLGNRQPAGWGYQVRTRPTLMAGYERAWPAVLRTHFGRETADLSVRASANVGTPFTYASTGLVLRFGRNLPTDVPVTHISLGPPRDGFRGTPDFGWYAWAGVDARAVAYNTFIQGDTFRERPDITREPFGHDLQLGVAAAWPRVRLGFTLVQRSHEFREQGGSDRFGQVALSFAY